MPAPSRRIAVRSANQAALKTQKCQEAANSDGGRLQLARAKKTTIAIMSGVGDFSKWALITSAFSGAERSAFLLVCRAPPFTARSEESARAHDSFSCRTATSFFRPDENVRERATSSKPSCGRVEAIIFGCSSCCSESPSLPPAAARLVSGGRRRFDRRYARALFVCFLISSSSCASRPPTVGGTQDAAGAARVFWPFSPPRRRQ